MLKKYFEFRFKLEDKLRELAKDDSGASAIEYAIIAGLIAVVIITATTEVGDAIVDTFESIRDALTGAGD
ncbi:Flp family type IVb pilin [Nitrincola tapanii]|uniref:Flp family type IVb pilin n=1 Tax=Nitrincola tapanii TaxID=1708751 RepID=A0A5A9W024_9GAMM|nr:Flp family type IVb pilin [Nitrincola tapanii]KAA0874097.1 Flp family type IVb pilin [Nitrincola tapanii]